MYFSWFVRVDELSSLYCKLVGTCISLTFCRWHKVVPHLTCRGLSPFLHHFRWCKRKLICNSIQSFALLNAHPEPRPCTVSCTKHDRAALDSVGEPNTKQNLRQVTHMIPATFQCQLLRSERVPVAADAISKSRHGNTSKHKTCLTPMPTLKYWCHLQFQAHQYVITAFSWSSHHH